MEDAWTWPDVAALIVVLGFFAFIIYLVYKFFMSLLDR